MSEPRRVDTAGARLGPPTAERRLELEARLGHAFADAELFHRALTHRSGAQEGTGAEGDSYERLEFLGDAVLGLLAGEWLYRRLPAAEGELSKRKSYLVSEPVLAEHARSLGLGPLLRLGVGEERSGGRDKPSLLADALEAMIGAVYLDGGLEAARRLVEPLLERGAVEYQLGADRRDAKTALQERLQAAGGALPEYRLAGSSGPDHEKLFAVECWADGRCIGHGAGSSKKRAEQEAAADALAHLGG